MKRIIFVIALAAVLGSGCQRYAPASIGTATMTADGTISLHLRADSGHGNVGDAVLVYKRGAPTYDEVFHHIGGIKPGDVKAVAPWP
jgi:hypothetical protein